MKTQTFKRTILETRTSKSLIKITRVLRKSCFDVAAKFVKRTDESRNEHRQKWTREREREREASKESWRTSYYRGVLELKKELALETMHSTCATLKSEQNASRSATRATKQIADSCRNDSLTRSGIGWRIGGRGRDIGRTRTDTTGHVRSYSGRVWMVKNHCETIVHIPFLRILVASRTVKNGPWKWSGMGGANAPALPWLIFFPLSFLSGRMSSPRVSRPTNLFVSRLKQRGNRRRNHVSLGNFVFEQAEAN